MELDQEELEGVPKPGDVVVEKYRVDRVLGVGGMGCVVAATHTTLGTPVAIKFLLARAARNPSNLERFQREAQAAARIKSDHVAKVTDVGTLPSGTPYMIMEFLEGEDVAERLKRGALAIPEACRYILQACEALAEAHQAGIVHRDLKPANLFLTPLPSGGDRVKVLDFGISKILAESGVAPGADLTKTATLMGSPLYMSPEQMMSAKDADARADIWALGVILHELITGIPPFIGGTLPEICSKILTAPPTPLSEALPGAPPNLAAVLGRALAKKPDERYPTLAELAVELAPFAGPEGQRSAEIVCRVLGRSPGIAAVPATSPSHPVGIHTTPGMAPPRGQRGNVATAPGGHGAPVVGHAATEVAVHGDTVASPHRAPAMIEGAHTAAPVAQTFDGSEPKRPRRALLAAAAFGLIVVLAAVIGLVRKGRRHAATAPDVAATDEPMPGAPADATSDAPSAEPEEVTGEAIASDASEKDGGEGGAETSATAPTATPPPPPSFPLDKPKRPRLPRPLRPRKHKVKQGDDQFN